MSGRSSAFVAVLLLAVLVSAVPFVGCSDGDGSDDAVHFIYYDYPGMSPMPVYRGMTAYLPHDPDIMVKVGNIFDHWESDTGVKVYGPSFEYLHDVDDSITFSPKWIPETYTVFYNANGGTGSVGHTDVVFGSSCRISDGSSMSMAGHHIGSWNTEKDGTGEKFLPSSEMEQDVANDRILYAIWVQDEYDVSFDYHGANAGYSTDSMACIFGEKYGDLPAPSKTGFLFDGWFTEETGGTEIVASTVFGYTGNITLHAHWTDGSGAECEVVCSKSPSKGGIVTGAGTFTKGSSVTLKAVAEDGYVFVRWSGSSDNPYTFNVFEDVVITAVFAPKNVQSNDISKAIGELSSGDVLTLRQYDIQTIGEAVIDNSLFTPEKIKSGDLVINIVDDRGQTRYKWCIDRDAEYDVLSKDSIIDPRVEITNDAEKLFPVDGNRLKSDIMAGGNVETVIFVDPNIEGPAPYPASLSVALDGYEGRTFDVLRYVGDSFIDTGTDVSVADGFVSLNIANGTTYAFVLEKEPEFVPAGGMFMPLSIIVVVIATAVSSVFVYRKGLQ